MSGAVATLVLGAGGASRMGEPKQLLPWRGVPLLRHTTETALAARLGPVFVVTGAHARECAAVLAGLPVRVVPNPAWRAGLSTSIRAGLAAALTLAAPPEAVAILLADQPFATAALLRDLDRARRAASAPLAACRCNGRLMAPAIFSAALFESLDALRGDAGARELLQAHREAAAAIDWPGAALDLDTPDEYRALRAHGAASPESRRMLP